MKSLKALNPKPLARQSESRSPSNIPKSPTNEGFLKALMAPSSSKGGRFKENIQLSSFKDPSGSSLLKVSPIRSQRSSSRKTLNQIINSKSPIPSISTVSICRTEEVHHGFSSPVKTLNDYIQEHKRKNRKGDYLSKPSGQKNTGTTLDSKAMSTSLISASQIKQKLNYANKIKVASVRSPFGEKLNHSQSFGLRKALIEIKIDTAALEKATRLREVFRNAVRQLITYTKAKRLKRILSGSTHNEQCLQTFKAMKQKKIPIRLLKRFVDGVYLGWKVRRAFRIPKVKSLVHQIIDCQSNQRAFRSSTPDLFKNSLSALKLKLSMEVSRNLIQHKKAFENQSLSSPEFKMSWKQQSMRSLNLISSLDNFLKADFSREDLNSACQQHGIKSPRSVSKGAQSVQSEEFQVVSAKEGRILETKLKHLQQNQPSSTKSESLNRLKQLGSFDSLEAKVHSVFEGLNQKRQKQNDSLHKSPQHSLQPFNYQPKFLKQSITQDDISSEKFQSSQISCKLVADNGAIGRNQSSRLNALKRYYCKSVSSMPTTKSLGNKAHFASGSPERKSLTRNRQASQNEGLKLMQSLNIQSIESLLSGPRKTDISIQQQKRDNLIDTLRFFFDETEEKCTQAKSQGGSVAQSEKEQMQFELERMFMQLRSAFNEIIDK